VRCGDHGLDHVLASGRHLTTAIAATLPPMPSLDWSTLLGAVSLVLALTIFLRDRINAERAQVDRVGPSATVLDYTGHLLDAPGVSARATAQVTVRNASDLPVHVAQVAYVLRTNWAVPQADGASILTPGADVQWFIVPPFDVAPQHVWTSAPTEQDLSHLAPEGATQLSLGDGVTCEIAWLLIRDNAGRRWEVRPGIARRAKRIRWYSRPKEFQPLLWFSPPMRRFLVTRSKVRLTSDQ
jgi:hypothetical protein